MNKYHVPNLSINCNLLLLSILLILFFFANYVRLAFNSACFVWYTRNVCPSTYTSSPMLSGIRQGSVFPLILRLPHSEHVAELSFLY